MTGTATASPIYGTHERELRRTMGHLVANLESCFAAMREQSGIDTVEHIKYRLKSDASMREKCRRMGLPETTDSALNCIHDAIGLRIVCSFLDDIYTVRDCIAAMGGIEIVREKDYVRNVKPNGYRSYHMIVRYEEHYAEIQIRTISMDTWAALEHHLRYKKRLNGNTALIYSELKRCADELASTDASMQTIRHLIYEGV